MTKNLNNFDKRKTRKIILTTLPLSQIVANSKEQREYLKAEFHKFHATGLFPHPLKTSRKLEIYLMFSGVIERDQRQKMV